MKNQAFLLASAFWLFFFLFLKCTESPNTNIEDQASSKLAQNYQPFPYGFNYPLERDTINNWVATKDDATIRSHAWNLFAGLNQPTESWKKIWQTWYPIGKVLPTKDTIIKNPIMPISGSEKPPYPSPFPKSECFENGNMFFYTALLLVASTFYNKEAAEWILGKRLGHMPTLDSLYKTRRKNIPTAPSKAMIAKNIYWPVSKYPKDYAPLPLWDGPGGRDPLVYNGFETWERAVAVTTNPNPPASVDVEYLFGYAHREDYNFKYESIKPIGLDQFYYLKLDKEVLREFSPIDSCVVNNSFHYVFNRNFEEGDYLICIAQHLITKEIDNWTMQTIWWHDRPNEGPYSKNRPDNIAAGAWQKYLLATAYYMAVPNMLGGTPHYAYNPYIELAFPEKNRINSNCQNCHIRAGYPELEHGFFVADMIGEPIKFPTKPNAFYNALREGYIGKEDSIFKELMRTDFNWAIPDRANRH